MMIHWRNEDDIKSLQAWPWNDGENGDKKDDENGDESNMNALR